MTIVLSRLEVGQPSGGYNNTPGGRCLWLDQGGHDGVQGQQSESRRVLTVEP